jgi:hypothetical protein
MRDRLAALARRIMDEGNLSWLIAAKLAAQVAKDTGN